MPHRLGNPKEEPEDHGEDPEGRWRVFTDGTSRGTRVITPAGQEVEGVMSLNFSIDAGAVGHLSLDIAPGDAGMTIAGATAEIIFVCPACSESMTHRCKVPF